MINREGLRRVQDLDIAAAGAKGLGVFAAREFLRGETVVVGRAIEFPPERTRMSVQVAWERHVEMDAPATLLNHSCAPNLGVRDNDWSAFDFVALRDIVAGEELDFDYAMTEYELVGSLSCRCGSSTCVGEIRPWRDRDQEWRDENAMWIAAYLQIHGPLAGTQQVGRLTRR